MKRTSCLPLKEVTDHGTKDYPCACYSINSHLSLPGGFDVKLHWHDEFEIIYCEQGTFYLEINMRKYIISEECFFFLKNDDLHSISAQGVYSEKAFVYALSGFSFAESDPIQRHLIQPLIDQTMLLPLQITREAPCFLEIKTEFLKIVSSFENAENPTQFQKQYSINDPVRFTRIKAALYNLLAILSEHQLFDTSASVTEPDRRIVILKQALSYMKLHASEKLYITDIAAHVNMNEQYFCRFFKKHIGKTPVEYLNELRVRQAARLLIESDLPVMDICLECGFNNLGNFVRVFRSHYTCTPLKYRKQNS